MIKSIKTGIILLAALLLAWLLPWCYAFVFASPSWSPFTLYSCVTHGFASVDFDRENNVAGRDLQGNTYTQQQFDSILPTFYYRQLAAEGRFPSEIEGVAVESRDVERTNFMFRTSPGEINRRRPTVYQLLESMPDRIDLEPATDVFRITGEGIEFVDMETNTIDQKKSAAFTKVLRDKGFSFPARVVSGNPSTRKRYDNGYLLVDDALRVYHMKQVRGRPFVRRTDVADSLQIGQIFVTEFADRKSLGFLVDSEKRFYTLGAEDYKLHEIPVGKFGPTRENMMIIGDMFYWTVTIQGAESKRYVAVNARDYSLADEYRPEEKPQAWAEYAKYLFPFELSFTSPLDGYAGLRRCRFRPSGWDSCSARSMRSSAADRPADGSGRPSASSCSDSSSSSRCWYSARQNDDNKPIRKRRADVFDVRPFITRSFPDQVRKINSSGIRIPAISSTPPRPRNPFGPRIITSPESTITINPAKKTSEKTVHQRDGL